MTHAFDILLCLMVLVVAGGAMLGRDLFVAIALFVVYGLLLSIAWVRLGAVDVALAEAAIGAGLTGILLLGAVARLRGRAPGRQKRAPITALLCAAVAAGLGWAVFALAGREVGLRRVVLDNLRATGVENPVTAVLLNFRAWDTLLESMVLLAALAGVWALGSPRWGPDRPQLSRHLAGDDVLSTFARFLAPVGLVVGAYTVWTGTSAPGGAFQAGTVLAAVWLLTMIAGLSRPPARSDRRLRGILTVGPLVFLFVGFLGLVGAGFLVYRAPHAKGVTLAIELALTFSTAAVLAMLVLGPTRSAR